jgi:TRAP transporter TAXI family solute receptor
VIGTKNVFQRIWASAVVAFLLFPQARLSGIADAKIDCGPVTNKSNDLPRIAAIGTNPAGTGAHAIAASLAAIGSKATPISVRVQPYNGPNAWMPLLQNAELEFGIMNILDASMAMSGTGNYEKPFPSVRVVSGGVFPFTAGMLVRDKSEIKQFTDLKGKRLAWDYGGHAINQTWLETMLEASGVKPADVVHVRVSNLNDGVRGVADGKVDASITGIGIALVEEVNATEPIRYLSLPNTDTAKAVLARYGASVVKQPQVTGVKGDTYVIGYPLHLVGSTKVSEKTVYTLVKAWWENMAELQTKHPLFKQWTKETQAITNFTVPYHPGAITFYKEMKLWTPMHEARHKEICQ